MPYRPLNVPADLPVSRRAEPRNRTEPLSELERIERSVTQLSHWMDTIFEVPLVGWRFGLDALIGLVPGVGDAVTTLVSFYILALASRCKVPKITLARMGLNVGIDFVLGSLPLVGDIFDVWWKANQKNSALLRERLAAPQFASRRATTGDWLFVISMFVVLGALAIGLFALSLIAVVAVWDLVQRLFARA